MSFVIFIYILSIISKYALLIINLIGKLLIKYIENIIDYHYNIKRKLDDENNPDYSNTKRKLNHDNTESSESDLESELESELELESEPESESESESNSESESGLESEDSDSCPDLDHSGNETEDDPNLWSDQDDSSHREWFEDIFLG